MTRLVLRVSTTFGGRWKVARVSVSPSEISADSEGEAVQKIALIPRCGRQQYSGAPGFNSTTHL
jgi:hypothetical protein